MTGASLKWRPPPSIVVALMLALPFLAVPAELGSVPARGARLRSIIGSAG